MTQFPRIHLNGSPAQHLMDDLHGAIQSLRDARDMLIACAPHGRDYYTISSTAINTAYAEHIARLERLDVTIAELENVRDSVRQQRDEREAIKRAIRGEER